MSVRPRQLVHGGRVLAAGLYVDPSLVGETEAQRRCLQAAQAGARIEALGSGYLIRFAAPIAVDCARAGGLPLVTAGGAIVSTPLGNSELRAGALGPNAVAIVTAGTLRCPPSGGLVDLSRWIDVSAFGVADVESLGAPPTIVRPVVARTAKRTGAKGTDATDATNVAAILGPSVPKPDPAVATLVKALVERSREAAEASRFGVPEPRRRESQVGGTPGGPTTGDGAPLRPGGGGGSWLSRWLARRFGGSQGALPSSGGGLGGGLGDGLGGGLGGGTSGDGSPAPRPPAPPRPGWLQRWFRRWALASPLADVVGRKQADFVRRTLQLFEGGNLDEALRRAIPFGAKGGPSLPPSLTVPKRRDSLTLGSPSPATSSSLGLGPDLYDQFKRHYQQAARTLEEAGRIEEAAYVLFELLGETESGIALLERHRKFELAAQMAEQREMDPALIIRLWFLAKNPRRAIMVARRTGAFAGAITALERTDKGLATRLRIVYADWLASGGNYAAAVDVVWPAAEARHLARAWIDRAVQFGGPVGIAMLVRKLVLFAEDPAAHQEVRDAFVALIEADDAEAASRRALLLGSLSKLTWPLPPLTAELSRALARRTLVDAGGRTGSIAGNPAVTDKLFQWHLERLPMASTKPVGVARPTTFDRHECGTLPVYDAVVLANDRVLAALGEAGLRLIDPQGRTVRSYVHPATRIVVTPETTHVITAVERGPTWSLHRVDLVTGRATRWCDAHISHASTDYDGSRWFVADESTVSCIDAQAAGLEALWQVGGLPAPVTALACGDGWLALTIGTGEDGEVWRYELTPRGPVLRTRTLATIEPQRLGHETCVSTTGALLSLDQQDRTRSRLRAVTSGGHESTSFIDAVGTPVAVGPVDFAVLARSETGVRLSEVRSATLLEPALELRGECTARLRVQGDHRVVTDTLGRIVVLDRALEITRWLLVT